MRSPALLGAIILAAVATIVGRAYCAEARFGVLKLDPARTLIEFRLAGSLHDSHGSFQLKRGTIRGSETSGQAGGEIIVDASSGNSGDFLRDKRMRNDILQSSIWPDIVFTPRHIEGRLDAAGNFHARLEGVLAVHGGDHRAVIEAEGRIAGNDLTATGHFAIPYVEWGLKDPSVLFLSVAKVVEIDIATAGQITWERSAPSKSLN